MSTVLVIGDGPLAAQMASLLESGGHTAISYLYYQEGRQGRSHVGLPAFLNTMDPEVDVVVEAVVGDPDAKYAVTQTVSYAVDAPLMTANLNISTAEAGSWTRHPERVVGWAALPPVADARVIEIAPSLVTGEAALQAAYDLFLTVEQSTVVVEDSVGGVLPRIVANLVNEAAFALAEGVATVEDIDTGMKLGTNYPHGPLRWGDLIGLDQVHGIITALGAAYGTDRYRPAPGLRQRALAGLWDTDGRRLL